MNYQKETFHKLSYPGAIDADGHFIEGNYIEKLEEMAGKLSAPARQKVLGENVAQLYKLGV